ncbi:Y-family DNA polymerase [Jidongwangia harbinensis]|uniref:Y-family DNA polymerase n=1 Tax=Jidongwangia harbinensis TaxID=2878561 RepID=UPI001CD9A4FE|nr:DNA polymerase Y family protein [Jidongwangia harbinensis]MCA2212412.1 DNA polymerase Y family protein [Jidongwangia harbinensis]
MMIWCPDWPVTAAEIVDGVPAAGPVVVLHANRVLACSEAARADGVRRGLRRREAQSRCPQLVVVEHDPGRDARAFEPVVAAVEEVAVGVEVIRPGACALAVRGPARYFGGEEQAAERIVEQVAQACAVESQVGVADGVFAAGLAARAGRIIAPGGTRAFLAGVPVEALDRPELTDLLRRLGVKTLGDFAALPPSDVLTRFGFDGALAHRLAAGYDHRPLAVRQPPPDLDVTETYDEPLERVDVAAFAGRVLAERLHEQLASYGLACTRLGIEAVTADGQELHRVWRHDGTLTSAAIAERVRWQLDGWLTGARRGVQARPTAGLVRLRLIPDGVLVHLGLQPGLWGDTGAERERAHRALSRVQGLLGPEAVVTAVLGGGRSADDQVRLVPWGDERVPARPAAGHADPYPGAGPAPVLAVTDDAAVLPIGGRGQSGGTPSADRAAGGGLRLVHSVTPDSPGSGSTGRPPETPPAPTPTRGPASTREQPVEQAVGQAVGQPVEQAVGQAVGQPVEQAVGQPVGQAVGQPVEQAVGQAVEQAVRQPVGQPEVTGGGRPRRTGRPARKAPALPPWPGRIPKPAPALVLPQPTGAVVLDRHGDPVGVSARLELTGDPASLLVDEAAPAEITGWAGPWPVEERWWAPGETRRRARFQVALADGRAVLLSLAAGHWAVEAIYD